MSKIKVACFFLGHGVITHDFDWYWNQWPSLGRPERAYALRFKITYIGAGHESFIEVIITDSYCQRESCSYNSASCLHVTVNMLVICCYFVVKSEWRSTRGLRVDHEATREDMHSYWRQHSKEASVKEMMLDSNAEELGKEEIPEIMSMTPDTSGLDVLELGAGIGWVLSVLLESWGHETHFDFF